MSDFERNVDAHYTFQNIRDDVESVLKSEGVDFGEADLIIITKAYQDVRSEDADSYPWEDVITAINHVFYRLSESFQRSYAAEATI